jgi:hypothetical protein
MLCREKMTVCSEIGTKVMNTPCGQNVEFGTSKQVAHAVTCVFRMYKTCTMSFLTYFPGIDVYFWFKCVLEAVNFFTTAANVLLIGNGFIFIYSYGFPTRPTALF